MSAQRDGRLLRGLVTAAGASYTGNVAFGAAVASGAIDNSRIRWVHHALYLATASLTALALACAAVRRRPEAFALVPGALTLAVLPYASGRMRRHATVAGLAAPSFATAVVLAWRRR